MSPEDRLLGLVRRGHELMARERAALARGELQAAGTFAEAKTQLLDALDSVTGLVRGTAPVRAAIAALAEDGRRNERMILAVRQGVAAARRRIEAILAAERGAVAYDRNGSVIASQDDSVRRRSRA